eukprot:gene631-20238_t
MAAAAMEAADGAAPAAAAADEVAGDCEMLGRPLLERAAEAALRSNAGQAGCNVTADQRRWLRYSRPVAIRDDRMTLKVQYYGKGLDQKGRSGPSRAEQLPGLPPDPQIAIRFA